MGHEDYLSVYQCFFYQVMLKLLSLCITQSTCYLTLISSCCDSLGNVSPITSTLSSGPSSACFSSEVPCSLPLFFLSCVFNSSSCLACALVITSISLRGLMNLLWSSLLAVSDHIPVLEKKSVAMLIWMHNIISNSIALTRLISFLSLIKRYRMKFSTGIIL